MADDLSQFLRSGAGRAALSPEKLELMGKQAAALLIEKNVPLLDGVVKIAAQHPDMNAEQVRRVVEFANTAAYLSFHEKNKTAGAEASYPQFKLADPELVLAKLGAATRVESETASDVSFQELPAQQSRSNAAREAALEELFLGKNREREKTSAMHSVESISSTIMDTKADLTALKESLEHSGERIQLLRKQAEADYYDSVKRHMLDGGTFTDVLRGAMEAGLGKDKTAEMLVPFLAQLYKEKVAEPKKTYQQVLDLTKVAHREVDASHPFVAGFSALATLVEEENKVASALEDIGAQLAAVQKTIKEEFIRAR